MRSLFRIAPVLALALGCSVTSAAAPAPRVPATAPAGAVVLADGAAYLMPPAGWTVAPGGDPAKSVTLQSADFPGMLTVMINTRPLALPNSADERDRMGRPMVEAIAKRLAQVKATVVDRPEMVTDPEVGLRIRVAFKEGDRTVEQEHLYQGVGRNLVLVSATSMGGTPEQSKAIHAAGRELLLSARVPGAAAAVAATAVGTDLTAKATPFPRGRLRIAPPAGWREVLSDANAGTIVTYQEPAHRDWSLTVNVTPLPAKAKADAQVRDALIDDLVLGQRQSFRLGGEEIEGKRTPIEDPRFLRKGRTLFAGKTVRIELTTRYRLIGDRVVTVNALGPAADTQPLMDLADKLALAIEPIVPPR